MPDHFYVYPAYLTKSSSRSTGRRVPADMSLGEVTLEEIVAAAKALGFTAEAEPERHYPRQVHLYAGRVKVKKQPGTTKTAFLRRVAGELRRRSSAGAA
jgi:signal recognition particle subunit SRP19